MFDVLETVLRGELERDIIPKLQKNRLKDLYSYLVAQFTVQDQRYTPADVITPEKKKLFIKNLRETKIFHPITSPITDQHSSITNASRDLQNIKWYTKGTSSFTNISGSSRSNETLGVKKNAAGNIVVSVKDKSIYKVCVIQ